MGNELLTPSLRNMARSHLLSGSNSATLEGFTA